MEKITRYPWPSIITIDFLSPFALGRVSILLASTLAKLIPNKLRGALCNLSYVTPAYF